MLILYELFGGRCDMALIKNKISLLFIVPVLFLSLSACTTAGKPSIGSKLKGDPARLPSQLLVLPVTVSISEISAGGLVQEDPVWCKEGEEAMAFAVKEFFANETSASLVDMPELTLDETELVHEHILLYDVIANQAFIAANMPAVGWSHLARDFHYTLGDGLHFLKQKTGADAALIVIGKDSISSGGRKTMVVMAALMGVGMPLGSSRVLVGVVDLEDGDILWFQNSSAQGNLDLRQSGDAVVLFTKAMEGYGGR
jgi:hypothetical protein